MIEKNTHEVNIKRLEIAAQMMSSFITRSNTIPGETINDIQLNDKIEHYSKLSYKIADSLINIYNGDDDA